MEILDLLFDNWWLLLILFGFFSNLFGKRKKEQQEQTEEGHVEENSIPFELPWQRTEPDKTDSSAEAEASFYKLEEEETERVINITNAEQMRESKGRGAPMENNQPVFSEIGDQIGDLSRRPNLRTQRKANYSKEAKKLLDFKNIEGDNVVQGMVWSQVFGKPRAQEPHRSLRYTRYGGRR